tara:strand:+ start:1978 stop:3222 length:1245 start_codon:yes stop_codon:yes gene_type:complete
MSESSSEQGANSKKRTVAQLVDRLRAKTSTERLSLLAHLSVGRTLCRVRDAIANGEEVSQKAAMALLCCGISLYRRHTLGDKEEEDEDTVETNALIKRSAVLIFVLLAAIEASRGNRLDLDRAREVVEAANTATLADVLKVPGRRKRKATDAGEASGADEAPDPKEAEAAEAWARVLTISSGELTLSVLQFVSHSIGKSDATDHETLADLFFRNSAACMAHKMLLKGGPGDFVSLRAAASNPIPREKRLLALAQAGESEAGQQILRDILLSFLLPSSIVGVRRHLLMSRAASTAAGVDHADAVNDAHSCAMAGSEFIWQHSKDPLERACALLAGVAILTTRGGEDPIRKRDAFVGRVSLPFFETTPPPPGVKRLALIPDQRRWVLYKIGKDGAPNVLCNLRGFDGLCDCLLEFV